MAGEETIRREGTSGTGKPVLGWFGWVLVTLSAGVIGTLLSNVSESAFYQQLERPSWAPPPEIFGPVWTTLYVLMGTAAWLVWRKAGFDGARTTLILYLVHLIANAAWTGIFFGLEAPGAALAEIIFLWLFIVLLVVRFHRVSTAAGLLLIPYLVWVTYATALTWAIWRLNPGL